MIRTLTTPAALRAFQVAIALTTTLAAGGPRLALLAASSAAAVWLTQMRGARAAAAVLLLAVAVSSLLFGLARAGRTSPPLRGHPTTELRRAPHHHQHGTSNGR